MKQALYVFKEAIIDLFRYPQSTLTKQHVDYDTYWSDKRKDNLGSLSHWQRQRADLALSHMQGTEPVSVVDIGCGDGSVLAYVKGKHALSRAIGVDISEVALARARELGIETIRSEHDPLKSLPVSLTTDYVFLFEVLEHMQNSEAQLRAMYEIADKAVFFSFPNTGYVMHRLRLLFGRFPLQWRVHPGEHLRFWTYADLVWWLKALGYTNYTIHTYEGVPFLKDVWPSLFGRAFFVYLPKQNA